MSETVTLDTRGLSCPLPAMMAKRAMKDSEAGTIEIIVDSGAACDNVERAARMAGWAVATEELSGQEFRLTLSKQ